MYTHINNIINDFMNFINNCSCYNDDDLEVFIKNKNKKKYIKKENKVEMSDWDIL